MQSDFTIIQHKFPKRNDIRIYPIGDVHLGAAEHMAAEWERFCDSVLEDPNAYLVILGDLLNNATRSSVSNVYEETMRPRDAKRLMCDMLAPLRERILVFVSGNHEKRSLRDADDDPTYDIACKLDLESLYRENIAFVKIQMGERLHTKGLERPTYTLVVTHGAGGGALTGSAVNKSERFGYVVDGADALILGHTHKPFITQPNKIFIDPRNNRVTFKPFKVISCTSWLSWGGYAAQKMLPPTSHAPQIITLCGKRKELRVQM